MHLSLKKRIAASFVVALLHVIVLSMFVFNFLNSLNTEIENISVKSNRVSTQIDNLRISAMAILKSQQVIQNGDTSVQQRELLKDRCTTFSSQIEDLDALFEAQDVKMVLAQMNVYVDSLVSVLDKNSLFDNEKNKEGISAVWQFSDKILDSFSEFQNIQYSRTNERDKKIISITKDIKYNMMIVLIMGLFVALLLTIIIPNTISLPFKKIKDAVRELQDCNFDVSIYYNQDDEIGELAGEMNKMIKGLKQFEELRTNRTQVENRKFDALANTSKKLVLLADAKGCLCYMNNMFYSKLQVQMEDVIDKPLSPQLFSESVVNCYDMAIKRRTKVENQEVQIFKRPETEAIEAKDMAKAIENEGNENDEEEDQEEALEAIFTGYANVIPIRGKDSSLDYYLMILSEELM